MSKSELPRDDGYDLEIYSEDRKGRDLAVSVGKVNNDYDYSKY
jgi:hypothetical protein